MSLPNPPSNYIVTESGGEKILSFTIDNSVINTRIKIKDISGIIFQGTTSNNSIKIPTTITGYNDTIGETENENEGWGPPNNPAVSVNYL